MTAGCFILNEKEETVKICETFLDEALVQRWTSAQKQPSGELNTEDDFRIREYRQDDEK
jgi:hypothetical protein